MKEAILTARPTSDQLWDGATIIAATMASPMISADQALIITR